MRPHQLNRFRYPSGSKSDAITYSNSNDLEAECLIQEFDDYEEAEGGLHQRLMLSAASDELDNKAPPKQGPCDVLP